MFEGKSIKYFLRKRVKAALSEESLTTSEITEFYIVNLLNDFLVAERLYGECNDHQNEIPLALLLLKALNDSSKSEKITKLKELGDKALYMSGFFAEFIVSKSSVNLDYYMNMGAGAYLTLSGIIENSNLSDLYQELSNNFSPLSRVIKIATKSEVKLTETELLRIYKKWTRTGDVHLLKLLQEHGITPNKDNAQ